MWNITLVQVPRSTSSILCCFLLSWFDCAFLFLWLWFLFLFGYDTIVQTASHRLFFILLINQISVPLPFKVVCSYLSNHITRWLFGLTHVRLSWRINETRTFFWRSVNYGLLWILFDGSPNCWCLIHISETSFISWWIDTIFNDVNFFLHLRFFFLSFLVIFFNCLLHCMIKSFFNLSWVRVINSFF